MGESIDTGLLNRSSEVNQAHKCVVVSGFICTGSSALIDALRGNDGFTAFLPEFKIMAGKDGLFEVVDSFCKSKSEGVAAFRRFAKRIIEEGRSPNRMYWYRRRLLQKVMGASFESSYVRKSYDTEIKGYRRVTRRYLRGLSRQLSTVERHEQINPIIEEATSSYFRDLCECLSRRGGKEWVIFNQTIKPGARTGLGLSLINGARVVVVDRDPRDQYIDLVEQGRLMTIIHRYGTPTGNLPLDFSNWYRRRRQDFYESYANDERVQVVRFEDLSTDPLGVLQEVGNFLQVEGHLSMSFDLFDKERALEKVGMWKSYSDKRSIDIIDNELLEYCVVG